jgi:protein O-GlcNAc transferase
MAGARQGIQSIMNSTKVGRNDPCPCGSGKKYKQCCQLKESAARTPTPVVDDATRRKLMDAFTRYQQGQLEEVQQICRRLLQGNPLQPDAMHLMGLVAHQQGRPAEALEQIDRALALGANDSMHSNRGIVLQAMGRHTEALSAYQVALTINPRSAPVLCNQGTSYQAMGEMVQAEQSFRQCLALMPSYAAALNGLGYCLLMRSQHQEAAETLQKACLADAQLIDARTNLGVVFMVLGRLDEALAAFEGSLALNPAQPEVLDRVGTVHSDANRTDEALRVFEQAYDMAPTASRLLRKSVILSHIYASKAAMLAERERLEQGLDALLQTELRQAEPSSHLFSPAIFNLAYQGHDVLPTLRKLVQAYLHLCPELVYRAPHVDQPVPAGRRSRLGFFSAHVHDHPVTHCFSQLVNTLAKEADFDVYLISYREPPEEAARRPYDQFAGRFVKVDRRVFAAREQIAALELDVLVYQDIGMDDVSYFLGYSRLARKQCVMGGHPVTTALPDMDVYMSSALGEYEGSESHYSEQLVALDPGTAFYERPKLPATFKDRVGLGLPALGSLYVCPMMLQKIHPDFDEAVAEILSLDKQGHVVFFAHPGAGWERDLKARLLRRLGDQLGQRLIFLPWITNRDDFAAINHHAAVVLDPFHFGIGSTAITTFAVGTPVVTWPASFLRGRVGLIYAKLLNLPECVAGSQQDYPALAVRIANDPALRASLRERILANSGRFFDSEESQSSQLAFFRSLLSAPELGAAPARLETA